MLKKYLFSLILLVISYTPVKSMEEKPEVTAQSEIFGNRVPPLWFLSLFAIVTGNTDIDKARIPIELKEKAYLLKSFTNAIFSQAEKIVLFNLMVDNFNIFNDEIFVQKNFPELAATEFDKDTELIKILNSIVGKAIDTNNALTAEFVLTHGAEATAIDESLIRAFENKNPESFALARKLNAKTESLGNKLYEYILQRDKEHLDFLINQGFDINKPLIKDSIPLIYLLNNNGHKDTVKFLLDLGADPNTQQASGFTPLTASVARNNTESILLLLEHGADIEASGPAKLTPLIIALSAKNPNLTKLLLDHKANPNAISSTGITPLMTAIRSGNSNLVRLLLESGADVHLPNKWGKLPLNLAEEFNNPAILELINKALQK